MKTDKYQGGLKEGEDIHPEAVGIAERFFGYGVDSDRWDNYHDVYVKQLSKFIKDINKVRLAEAKERQYNAS